jgi:hypothetical protein
VGRIYTVGQGQDVSGAPLGVVIMDAHIPYPPGTPGNARTFDQPVLYSVVRGADMEHLIYDPQPELVERFLEAGRELVRQGVRAVIGNCGFMILFQEQMADELPVPVYMSSLLQLPLVARGLRQGQRIGIISSTGHSLTPRHLEIATGGVAVDFTIRGLEDRPAFKAAIHDQVGTLDFDAVEAEVVEAALDIVRTEVDIGAILFECTDLPPYAFAVQQATGLPVFDITTMTTFALAGAERRRFEA